MTITGVGTALACGGGWQWHIDIRIELRLLTRSSLEVERLLTDGLTLSVLVFGSFTLGINGTNPGILRKGHFGRYGIHPLYTFQGCLTCSVLF